MNIHFGKVRDILISKFKESNWAVRDIVDDNPTGLTVSSVSAEHEDMTDEIAANLLFEGIKTDLSKFSNPFIKIWTVEEDYKKDNGVYVIFEYWF